jgi:hypothetical protein
MTPSGIARRTSLFVILSLASTALTTSAQPASAQEKPGAEAASSPERPLHKLLSADDTFYRPVNPADRIIDPDGWQPITFTLADGRKVTPGFLTPHWYRVKTFVLERSDQFRPGPPPRTTTDDELLRKETAQVLEYNATLTPEQKAIVEFMRDGPRSTGQSGHWLRFAQDVSRRDRQSLEGDVKPYFCIANVAQEAFISCWGTRPASVSHNPRTLTGRTAHERTS